MRRGLSGVVLLGVLAWGGEAAAQVAWDSPLFLPPTPAPGFGIFLMDAAGGGLGVMGLYRSPGWNYGLRGGLAETTGRGGVSVFGGVDFSGTITRATPDFPLDVDWVVGAGAGIGEGARVSVPVGLTTGRGFRAEGATFTPYVTPRVVLDAFFDSDRDRNTRIELAADIGLDLDVLRGTLIRFAATVGRDRSAVALGLAF